MHLVIFRFINLHLVLASALADGDYIKVIAEDYLSYYGTDRAKDVQVIEKLEKPVVPVTSVELTKTEASIKIGKTTTIGVTILPAIATTKTYTYSILAGGESVISVEDGTGENEILITALAEGTATVKVVSDADDTKYATCAVTVTTSGLPEFDKGDWVKVTNLSELTAGSYVIVASKENNYAMKSYVSGDNLPNKGCTKVGDMLTYDADFAKFELQEYSGGGLSFFDVNSENYLSSSGKNSLKAVASQDANTAWTLNIADGTLTAFNNANTGYEIQENTSNHNFCSYKSTQNAIDLYKYYVKADKIIYDANGGTNAPASSRANDLGVATVTDKEPTYGGYNFVNWTANQDGTGKVYTAGEEVELTEDITIYAQWEKKPIEGTPYVLVFKSNRGDNYYAMNKDLEAYEVELFNGKLLNIPEADRENITWYRKEVDGGVTFQNAAEGYLMGGNKTDLSVGNSAHVWTWNTNGYYEYLADRTFFYQVGVAFKNYAVSNLTNNSYTGAAMFINEYVEGTIETPRTGLTIGKLGTFCETKAVAAGMFEGAEFYEILNKDAASKNVTLQEVLKLEAGMPYIIVPTAEQIRVIYNGESKTAQHKNGLYGWLDTDFKFDSQIDSKDVYFVNGGRIVRCGDNCTIKTNRAYIVLDEITQVSEAPGRRRLVLGVEGKGVATGMEEAIIMNNGELKKVVIDGQFYILRDGKVFDAQGKLVK